MDGRGRFRRMFWRGRHRTLAFAVGLALGAAILPGLGACVSSGTPIGRIIEAMRQDRSPLPEQATQELARFAETYRTYAIHPDDNERLDYFNFAYRRVRTNYVHDVDDGKLIDAAIEGITAKKPAPGSLQPKELVETALHKMLAALDPHSSYMDAEEFKESFASTKGEFGGLGIQVTMEDGLVKVISPIEGTPAEKAGIVSGDLITHVGGDSIKGMTLRDAVRLMRGPPGKPLTIRVRRPPAPDFDVTLVRDVIKVKSVRWSTEGDIGYIRVSRFSEKTASGLKEAMDDIRGKAGSGLRGIVVDLRNNPGGLLNQSVVVADAFLNKGEIVSVRGRTGGDNRAYEAEGGDIAAGLPMVVLINSGSASASEIVASALQYHHRAVLMGARTFGKGSVQTIMPMPVEGALRLTTALYYSPSGQTLQALGVRPDVAITAKEDPETPRRREADLPGSIPASAAAENGAVPRIPEETCPAAGEDGKDKVLGCALAYFRAGTMEAFVRQFAARAATQG